MDNKKDVFWSDEVEIGDGSNVTTWIRVTPQFRDFYKKVKEKKQVLGVILSDDELNFGFIVKD